MYGLVAAALGAALLAQHGSQAVRRSEPWTCTAGTQWICSKVGCSSLPVETTIRLDPAAGSYRRCVGAFCTTYEAAIDDADEGYIVARSQDPETDFVFKAYEASRSFVEYYDLGLVLHIRFGNCEAQVPPLAKAAQDGRG